MNGERTPQSATRPVATAHAKSWGLATNMFLGLVLMVGACDLSRVEVPIGEPAIVVHGVMRPDKERQFIIVEESFVGMGDSVVYLGGTIPTDDAPPQPLEGATVLVTNHDLPDDSCGSPVRFDENPRDRSVETVAGVYWAPVGCPSMRPGDSLELRIVAPNGDIVTGSTLVTGMMGATLTVQGETVLFGTDTTVSFNRDRHTLHVRIEPSSGRLLQVEVMRFGDLDMVVGEDIWPGATIHADTTSVTLPGDLIDATGWRDGGDVFTAGRRYIMVAALTDRNVFDFGRSRSNRFTGRGFINHLDGGIGVFGSLTARSLGMRVIGDFDDPREGVYSLRGTVRSISIDALLTVYAASSSDSTGASGFLDGDWFRQSTGTEGAIIWESWHADTLSVEGTLEGNEIRLAALQPTPGGIMRIMLVGDHSPDVSFDFSVADSIGLRSLPLGTLTASQQ